MRQADRQAGTPGRNGQQKDRLTEEQDFFFFVLVKPMTTFYCLSYM